MTIPYQNQSIDNSRSMIPYQNNQSMENSNQQLDVAAAMEKLGSMMAFCEAPLDGTSVPPAAAPGYGASATAGGGSNVVALLDAAATKLPVEKLVATMAFCEAPLDGTFDGTTSAPPSGAAAAGYASSATGGSNMVALLAASAKKLPVKKLVATMAFCEAPFDGTLDGTTSSSGAAGGSSASATNFPGEDGGGNAKALRRARLAEIKKQFPLREHPLLLREKTGAVVVDGLSIFEAVAME